MRWTLNCILLASLALTISASEDDARIKRDLSFIKSLIAGKFFGAHESAPEPQKVFVRPPGNYRLFRVPGFEKILVKATPKKPVGVVTVPNTVVEEIEPANPSVAIVNSYLGTTKLNDTLYALQGVKNLLQSGVLEAQREGIEIVKPASYPAAMFGAGKIFEYQRPGAVGESIPLPVIEGYRPVEVTRLPDLPIPSSYSYKQLSKGGMMSYTANDNKNVVVTETNKPVPLPPFLTYRIQEAMSMGGHSISRGPFVTTIKSPPPPLSVYEVTQVHPPPPVVIPSSVSSSFSVNQVPFPSVHVPTPPVRVASSIPSSYSYNHVHNDGSVTSYTGSGNVIERKGERPTVVIETSNPPPLPMFLTQRIQNAATTAIAARIPQLHEVPVVYPEPPVIVEQRPAYFYDHRQMSPMPPFVMNHYNKPLYREDVNVHFAKHKNRRPVDSSSMPSGYSYKTVHTDGSVSTYTDSGVHEEGAKGPNSHGTVLYPSQYPEAYHYHNHHPQLVREEICLDPPPLTHTSAIYPSPNGHVHQTIQSKPGGYSYQSVHGDGLTTYSGSGHVEHHKLANPAPIPMAHAPPAVMVPELVTPGEFFADDFAGPQKVMFAQPVLSQYVYKQINHNNPNELTVANVGPMPVDGQVNVKVGSIPVPNSYLSPPAPPSLPVLPSVTPRGPNEYVFVPPSDVNEPLPTKKPAVADAERVQSGHSFTHVTNEGVHTNKDGAASFESATPAPVVNVVKTSSSVSTSRGKLRPKFKPARVNSTPRSTTTTDASTPNTVLSLSSNPIVVLPEEPTFSFKQDRADGSSITVVGNKEKVSVIEDNRSDDSHHRGDIPSTSL